MTGTTIVKSRSYSRRPAVGSLYRKSGGGRGGRGGLGPGLGKAARRQLAPMRTPGRKAGATSAPVKRSRARQVAVLDQDDEGEDDEETAAQTTSRGQANLENLARHQSFDGCFSLAVLSVVQLTVDVAQARAALLDGIPDEVFATILAIAFMAKKLALEVEQVSWEAMYDKARVFVEGAVDVPVDELEAKAVLILA
ncbi:hypothetical protein B0H12DRAFT_364947 [Mycena haematopus]|nr:hypothetical protein B0H12DRAFT_364947 [Mycena haematopus]